MSWTPLFSHFGFFFASHYTSSHFTVSIKTHATRLLRPTPTNHFTKLTSPSRPPFVTIRDAHSSYPSLPSPTHTHTHPPSHSSTHRRTHSFILSHSLALSTTFSFNFVFFSHSLHYFRSFAHFSPSRTGRLEVS